MFKQREILSAIDIGSSKITVLVGEFDAKGEVVVTGIGTRDAGDSVCKGEIRVVDDVARLLGEAIDDAFSSVELSINPDNIFVSVTGGHIKARKGAGMVTIINPDRKIRLEDIEEAIKSSRRIPMPPNYSPLNYVGTDFLIDGTKKMENPLAQTGNKLEAFSYCIMGDINAVKNYKSPLDECGYSNLKDTPVFSGIASSVGALNQEDIKNGVLLIDIGAGTTEFVIFHGSGYFDCGVIPVGCDHIANDFAVGLDLHISKAKKLLIDNFKSENLPQSCHIEVKGHFEVRKIPFVSVEKIFNMRVNEIMEIIGTQIKMSNLKRHLGRGVVICGGGANFPLLLKSAEQCFSVPARIGLPIDINGSISEINDPRYTCVSGLLKYGVQKKMQDKNRVKSILSKLDTNLWTGLLKVGRNLRDAIKF